MNNKLSKGLKPRHLTMISIAGVIGVGLFVGSGEVIAKAGPAAILAYIFAAILVVVIMRMLGEMATIYPDSGSFSSYADKALGSWAGFTIGWLYWWFWVLLIPIESNVTGLILHSFYPFIPVWIFALIMVGILTTTNLLNVKNYGEFEFWFALIKVVAIFSFLVLGGVAILNWLPHSSVHGGLANFTQNGGFMPNGIVAVIGAMLSTMFAFLGVEIVTIAAAESKNPEKEITLATKSVIWRVSLFYIGSIFVVIALVPWNDPQLCSAGVGAYLRTLEILNIPYAKGIMSFVIIASASSCLNSCLYTSSRMLYSLSTRGDAPKIVAKLLPNSTPGYAVIFSALIGFIAVIAQYEIPNQLFEILVNTTGAIALLVYLVIAMSQLKLRQKIDPRQLKIKMWLFPWLTYAMIIFIVGVLFTMLFSNDFKDEIISTFSLAIILVIVGYTKQRKIKV
jgi:GABA permease